MPSIPEGWQSTWVDCPGYNSSKDLNEFLVGFQSFLFPNFSLTILIPMDDL